MRLPISTDATIELREADYKYGEGKLRLRITDCPDLVPDYIEWIMIKAREIIWNGTERPERTVTVRVRALVEALRRAAVGQRGTPDPGSAQGRAT